MTPRQLDLAIQAHVAHVLRAVPPHMTQIRSDVYAASKRAITAALGELAPVVLSDKARDWRRGLPERDGQEDLWR